MATGQRSAYDTQAATFEKVVDGPNRPETVTIALPR
jgi:hypothetical protein